MLLSENLIGAYITLEPINQSHKSELKQLVEDRSIWAHFPYDASGAGFERWFDKTLSRTEDGTQMCFVVRNNQDNRAVGCSRFYDIYQSYLRLAIGHTFYHADIRGTKVNPECKKLMLTAAFEVLNMERVEFITDSNNARSRAAITKLGAKEEGILRNHMTLDNGYQRNSVVFSILKSEWPEVQHSLKMRLK